MSCYIDRRGQLIPEPRWRELQNSHNYVVVRQYVQGQVPTDDAVTASVTWNGVKGSEFILRCKGAPEVICEDELSAVAQFEDYLVTKECGAWYPSGGALDRNGKQVSAKFSFHSKHNLLRQEVGQKIDLEDIADSPDYGTW